MARCTVELGWCRCVLRTEEHKWHRCAHQYQWCDASLPLVAWPKTNTGLRAMRRALRVRKPFLVRYEGETIRVDGGGWTLQGHIKNLFQELKK